MGYDPLNPDTDVFRPPAIPTLVGCLHCGEAYDSYRIEWRILQSATGEPHGFWCCPIPGCDGKGFGFDILPVDPDYQDERGGWVRDSDEGDDEFDESEGEQFLDEEKPSPDGEKQAKDDDEPLPW